MANIPEKCPVCGSPVIYDFPIKKSRKNTKPGTLLDTISDVEDLDGWAVCSTNREHNLWV